MSELLSHGGKRRTPILAFFHPTDFTDSHNTTQKQYLAFVKECSCTHPRAANKTSGDLEVACRPALQSRVSTVLAAFAGYCDTLGSPFQCYLVHWAQPVKNDTRMDANSDLCREARDHDVCLFRGVCGANNCCAWTVVPPSSDVRVSHWRLSGRGPSFEKGSTRCMWKYNEGVILL